MSFFDKPILCKYTEVNELVNLLNDNNISVNNINFIYEYNSVNIIKNSDDSVMLNVHNIYNEKFYNLYLNSTFAINFSKFTRFYKINKLYDKNINK
jgi:hypothetical protein